MSRPTWHLVTGEYPPQPGGVSDYTAQLADALATTGAEVHVWTSSTGQAPGTPGVTVHRNCGRWSPADLDRLGVALDAFPSPRRLLVQYTPNSWGRKGLNLGFCRWLVDRRRGRGDEIRVMFHEVAYSWRVGDRPTRLLLSAAHRWMARTLLRASTHVDVTTPAWERRLRSCSPKDRRVIGWRPVPSNIAVVDDAAAAAAARKAVAPRGQSVVASFSSFSELTGPLLSAALPGVLRDRPDRVGLLIGLGGDRLAARLVAAQPWLDGRLVATGELTSAEVSAHLRAADLVLQLYPDGITTRRTSAMAALAHGLPVVTNSGHLTEPFWSRSEAVAMATGPDGVRAVIDRLLADPAERERLGSAARRLYERRFALERTVEALAGVPLKDAELA